MTVSIKKNNDWVTIRSLDPGAGTTFTETDWVLTQNIAAAEAANSLFTINHLQTFPGFARITFMITLFGADKKPITDQGSVKVGTIFVDEIGIVAGEKRLVHNTGTSELGSVGISSTSAIPSGINNGLFALRLMSVSGMPAGTKTLIVECKYRHF